MKKFIQNWFKRYFSDTQVIILVLLLFIGFILVILLGHMLLPVFVAVVIAYLLDGIVCRLQRLKIPRSIAVSLVSLISLALVLALIIGLLPRISYQITQFIQEFPNMVAEGQKELLLLQEKYPAFISQERISQIFAYLGSDITRIGQYVLSVSMSSVRGIIEILVYLVLVPFLVFFFLKDKHLIFQWIGDLLPEERTLTVRVWNEVNQQISNYIRGKIWEIIIVWAATYVTFFFIGLQFSMVLALFVGLAVLIPYIGATVMIIPITLIGFFQWGLDLHLAYVLISYGIIHALDGNLLAPLLLSEVVHLHPVAVIVAILVFGGLWGIWGLILAIPLATLVHSVYKAWTGTLARPIPVGAQDTYETLAESCSKD